MHSGISNVWQKYTSMSFASNAKWFQIEVGKHIWQEHQKTMERNWGKGFYTSSWGFDWTYIFRVQRRAGGSIIVLSSHQDHLNLCAEQQELGKRQVPDGFHQLCFNILVWVWVSQAICRFCKDSGCWFLIWTFLSSVSPSYLWIRHAFWDLKCLGDIHIHVVGQQCQMVPNCNG